MGTLIWYPPGMTLLPPHTFTVGVRHGLSNVRYWDAIHRGDPPLGSYACPPQVWSHVQHQLFQWILGQQPWYSEPGDKQMLLRIGHIWLVMELLYDVWAMWICTTISPVGKELVGRSP